jgi:hypothetical protein
MISLKFNVFGKPVLVTESTTGWVVYHIGNEGKRRLATDIRIPADIKEAEIGQWLDDIYHEWATAEHPVVERLD